MTAVVIFLLYSVSALNYFHMEKFIRIQDKHIFECIVYAKNADVKQVKLSLAKIICEAAFLIRNVLFAVIFKQKSCSGSISRHPGKKKLALSKHLPYG